MNHSSLFVVKKILLFERPKINEKETHFKNLIVAWTKPWSSGYDRRLIVGSNLAPDIT